MAGLKQISGFLVRFTLWTIAFAAVYSLLSDAYASLVVRLAQALTDPVVPVTLFPDQRGIVIISPLAHEPMGAPYNLFLIGLNAIFAPALVLATVGLGLSGVLRSLLVILLMVVFQTLEVLTIVLYFIADPNNPSIALGYQASTVAALRWIYLFLDRMSYVLFPFLAWALVCPDVLRGLWGRISRDDASS